MNTKLSLAVSLVTNIALAISVVFLAREFSSLPEATPALVIYRVTNAPPQALENKSESAPAPNK